MEYLDTSYIISLAVVDDVNHGEAVKIKKKIVEPVASKLTVIELYAYYSRNPDRELLEFSKNLKLVVESSVRFSLMKAGAKIVEASLDKILSHARELAVELKLKTLDLIHVATAIDIGAETIVTFDKDIRRLREKLYHGYGITIIP